MIDKYSWYFTILSVVCTEHEAEILAFAPPRLMYCKTWGRDHHARQGQGCVSIRPISRSSRLQLQSPTQFLSRDIS